MRSGGTECDFAEDGLGIEEVTLRMVEEDFVNGRKWIWEFI